MHEDLIKRLRNCTSDTVEDCAECPYQGGYKGTYCMNGLISEAADALEELQKALNAVNDAHNEGYDVGYWAGRRDYEPKWIPVTERLPEKDGAFITAYSKGGVSQNWYMTFHHGGGKWYQNSEDTGEVTHWMPLPQPPKEETT